MRRKPAVNTATSLIKRKETAEFKALLQRIQQAFPKLFQQTRLDPPRCGKKKNHDTETKISEVNETNSLKTNIKYITNGETDTFIYLLGYLNFMESCFATV